MSTKLEKDEQITINEVLAANPSSEELADLIFSHGMSMLSWKDIQVCSTVCKGWKIALKGNSVATAEYSNKFREQYGEKNSTKLFNWRKKCEEGAVEQCLLLLLEGEMLLRELAEFKRPPPPKLYADIRHQIAKFPIGDTEEQDLLSTIQQLRKQLLHGFKENTKLEANMKEIEHKIGLLIMHRTSILELDRKKTKRKKKVGEIDNEKATFYNETKKMDRYSELFYLLRTEPKYLAKLAYLIPPSKKERQQFAETVILTMYANAFSPLEEFLLIELLQKAVENEIKNATKIEEFTEADSVVPMMIMSYNKRKQGRKYLQGIFSKTLKELLESSERFGADPNGQVPDAEQLKKWCDRFFPLIIDSIDSLPYGLRLLCKHIHDLSKEKFKKANENDLWKAVGYFTFYRFIGLTFIIPDEFGLCEKDDFSEYGVALNLIAVSKILKSVFSDLKSMDSGPFVVLNDWVESKIPLVIDYFKKVIDVPPPEDFLHVNKYAQLSKIEKDSLVITAREIVSIHTLVDANKEDLAPDDKDPLRIILSDLHEVPKCPPEDETEVQLNLTNRFPPQLSKLDKKKNLKTETIDDAIKIMQKIPGFSGDTFLEIFVRMKLHCQKAGEAELAKEVNNVIANLQNLAKHGLVKPDNGFNSFLKDIQSEVQARGKRKAEHMKEIERLQKAIKELEEQKEHMEKKIGELNSYLDSVRKKAADSFVPQTKKFKFKDLLKMKVIADSEIPTSQQGKVQFVIEQKTMDEFHITGKIKGLPVFTRDFDLKLEQLLAAKEDGQTKLDTDKGIELYIASTIIFLNKQFFSQKK